MDTENIPYNKFFDKAPSSYWLDSTRWASFHALKKDIKTDIAIIGGGIAGITSAYLLKNEGYKVALIEANEMLHGTTSKTTAKITCQHGLKYNKLLKKFGEEKTAMYGASNQFALDFLSDLIKNKSIACDFISKPSYIFAQKNESLEELQKEVDVCCNLNFPVSYVEKLDFPFNVKAAIKFDNQAQFHPLKYLSALAKEIPLDGSYIFENTRIVNITHDNKLITEFGNIIQAKKIIITTHFPCYDGLGLYFTRMHAVKDYIIAFESAMTFPNGMYLSAESPTLSLRSQPYNNGELILLGGGEHNVGENIDTDKIYSQLVSISNDKLMAKKQITRWSTQDLATLDGIPYIGELSTKTHDIFVATGFDKWGMTTGTLAALMFRDLIKAGGSPYSELYSPSRFTPVASAKNFFIQNAEVAENYIKGNLASLPSDLSLEKGECKIEEVNGKKIGVYKDEFNSIHSVNIKCPHLGCTLVWNSAEKIWDCPCHGSSFTYDGKIIETPATKPLASF